MAVVASRGSFSMVLPCMKLILGAYDWFSWLLLVHSMFVSRFACFSFEKQQFSRSFRRTRVRCFLLIAFFLKRESLGRRFSSVFFFFILPSCPQTIEFGKAVAASSGCLLPQTREFGKATAALLHSAARISLRVLAVLSDFWFIVVQMNTWVVRVQ